MSTYRITIQFVGGNTETYWASGQNEQHACAILVADQEWTLWFVSEAIVHMSAVLETN